MESVLLDVVLTWWLPDETRGKRGSPPYSHALSADSFTSQLAADNVRNGNSGESASTLTADRSFFVSADHLSGGRDTPAGLVVNVLPFAGAAAGLGAAFNRVITLSVMSRLLSAATITLVCDPTSKIIA